LPKLVVIPSDPLEAYYKAGYDKNWLEDYYNPLKFFDEVYLLSPIEKKERFELEMKIIPTKPEQFKNRLKELNISIVRAYGGYWACDLACSNKLKGVPVVVSVHDSNPKMLYNSIENADAIFCTSKIVEDLVLTKVRNEHKVYILPNRVNFNVMYPYKPNQLIDLNKKYPFKFKILHVGRKAEQKNLDTAIKALKILGTEYCLLAIGRGDQIKYKKIAKNEGVKKQYFFLESVQNKQLARYYSWADCMCTPSKWEGFGMVFIEALACESIVVTSNIRPINEYIEHMKNGLLVDEYENPEALAKMIEIACNDYQTRVLLKKNARKSVERFEKKRIDELEVSYYKKILKLNSKESM